MKTVIHVNQHVIKKNRTTGSCDPVLTVKTYKSNLYAHEVQIHGPARVVYSPDKPLSCGAHVWIETQSKVTTDENNTAAPEASHTCQLGDTLPRHMQLSEVTDLQIEEAKR